MSLFNDLKDGIEVTLNKLVNHAKGGGRGREQWSWGKRVRHKGLELAGALAGRSVKHTKMGYSKYLCGLKSQKHKLSFKNTSVK